MRWNRHRNDLQPEDKSECKIINPEMIVQICQEKYESIQNNQISTNQEWMNGKCDWWYGTILLMFCVFSTDLMYQIQWCCSFIHSKLKWCEYITYTHTSWIKLCGYNYMCAYSYTNLRWPNTSGNDFNPVSSTAFFSPNQANHCFYFTIDWNGRW